MKIHGQTRTAEFIARSAAIDRCFNPNRPGYENYGGRGITVCQRWRDSFEAFLADVGPRPSARHMLERIDNDGNYEPGNCRWATAKEQANNRRNNRLLEAFGRRLTISQWADETGLLRARISQRLASGWDVVRALTTPSGAASARTEGGA